MDPRREGAMETLRAIDQATARIDALIARAGGPVMVVKSGEQDRLSVRFKKLDDLACEKLKEKKYTRKSSALIDVLCDEIEKMDGQMTDMANTIDRLEAALHNVINEREQLKRDLHSAATVDGLSCGCRFCAHENKGFDEEPCKTCVALEGCQCFEWRGIPEEADAHE